MRRMASDAVIRLMLTHAMAAHALRTHKKGHRGPRALNEWLIYAVDRWIHGRSVSGHADVTVVALGATTREFFQHVLVAQAELF